MPGRLLARANLVERLETRLRAEGFPRLVMTGMVTIAGGVAFLCSALTLWAGLDSMAVRYGLAALVGYVTFGAVLRIWISWRRDWLDDVVDLPTFDLDLGGGGSTSTTAPSLFAGGRSGGGGASEAFTVEPYTPPAENANESIPLPVLGSPAPERGSSGAIDADVDARVWMVIVAAALAFGALVAVAYVVYSAPILLTEVALDASVMSGVYRSVRRHDDGHWLGAVWRRTWLPALVVIVCMAVAGYLLQLAVPDARSIGGVIRALRG